MSLFEDPEIYRGVLESMRNGIYLVDCSEKIQFWNEGAERITGYLRQDVLGHFCRDFFAPQEQDGKDGLCELGGALPTVLRDGKSLVTNLTLRHKAGHQVALRVRSIPIRNRDGAIAGAAETFDEDLRAIYSERRHDKLAHYGCIDESTGILTRSYIETHVRECLTTFTAHRIPFSVLCVEIDGAPRIFAPVTGLPPPLPFCALPRKPSKAAFAPPIFSATMPKIDFWRFSRSAVRRKSKAWGSGCCAWCTTPSSNGGAITCP